MRSEWNRSSHSRGARRGRNGAARVAEDAGEPGPCPENGGAWPTDRRHRARDQEPPQFRQQLCRTLGRATGGIEGALDSGKRAESLETIGMLTGNLEKIAEHGRRADGIVRGMLQHSRGSSGDWQVTDLNALVEESLNLAYHGARAQDQDFKVSLELDLDRNLAPTEVVSQDVSRVLLNLISNGFYAVTERGRAGDGAFRPLLKIATREFGEGVEIRVRDNGVGIPPEHCEKLFQPFFTTKPTGEGTGLGLSISYEIITQQHGGTITVDGEVGDFTEFTVRLPRRGRALAG